MNKQTIIIISAISTVILVGIGMTIYGLTRPKTTTMSGSMSGTSMSPVSDGSEITKSITYQQYATLSGEEYDKTFLANMSAHHQGAIDMATLALSQAKHVEIKTLAADIIKAQTGEMTNMMAWQMSWGYVAKGTDIMMHSSAMSTMNEMSGMTDELRNLTGDAFDKKFMELMIQHHQSAIDMATPGEKNASHQQVKDLSKAIVTAQSNEIKQMQQWKKAWNYTN